MSSSTERQRERKLIQHLPEFFLTQLGHTPERVDCQIVNHQIVITIDGAMTRLEKLLTASHQSALVNNVRASLDQVLRTKLKAWMKELLQTEIIDLFVNTDIAQDRMMAIAILPPTSD